MRGWRDSRYDGLEGYEGQTELRRKRRLVANSFLCVVIPAARQKKETLFYAVVCAGGEGRGAVEAGKRLATSVIIAKKLA